MDRFAEGDPFFRIPASSSSFLALATLRLPSPTPSFSDPSLQIAFEEIPVYLWGHSRESYLSADVFDGNSFPHGLESLPSEGSTESFISICTFGTFGPKWHQSGCKGSLSENCSEQIEAETDGTPQGVINEVLNSNDPLGPQKSPPPSSIRITGGNAVEQNPRVSNHLSYTSRTPQTRDAHITPGPRPVDSLVQETKSKTKVELKRIVRDRNRNVASNALETHRRLSGGTIPTVKYMPNDGNRSIGSPRVPSSRVSCAQTDFAWLHGVTIDFLIDQEGFRSATPAFRYSGVKRGPKDEDMYSVQFRPVSKQSFYFHYNPFDSSPILRRVTIHGEETQDYISKQAYLTLKSNGVYSVHGTELCSVPLVHSDALNRLGHDPDLKLHWQFHYMVDDRLDAQGRVRDGEKKFVPLTFTCSPCLLHPSQGKRINLIHMFKKGVATKLTAEKFCVPVVSRLPVELSVMDAESKTRDTSAKKSKIHKEDIRRSHRRVQSHAPRNRADGILGEHGISPTRDGSGSSRNEAASHFSGFVLQRRRRASSAGENASSVLSVTSNTHQAQHEARCEARKCSTTPYPTRNILPPSRLAEMFN